MLVAVTLSLATISAFFSVWGLAHTFGGIFWSIVIMGIVLECGKLITASFLYKFWNKIFYSLKAYLVTAVILLMVITAIGHFGYLSAGYQQDTINYKDTTTQIQLLREEQATLQQRKKEIDAQIAQLPPEYVRGRQKLIQSFASETKQINARLPQITTEIQKLSSDVIKVEAHVGPIIYIARASGMTIDDATKWLILMLIIVFDPLAVALTIATNIAIKVRQEEKSSLDVLKASYAEGPSVPVNNPLTIVPDLFLNEPQKSLIDTGTSVKPSPLELNSNDNGEVSFDEPEPDIVELAEVKQQPVEQPERITNVETTDIPLLIAELELLNKQPILSSQDITLKHQIEAHLEQHKKHHEEQKSKAVRRIRRSSLTP